MSSRRPWEGGRRKLPDDYKLPECDVEVGLFKCSDVSTKGLHKAVKVYFEIHVYAESSVPRGSGH